MNASKNIKNYIKYNQASLGAKQKLEEITKKKTILMTKQETANNNINLNVKKQISQGNNCFSPKGRNHQQSFINNFGSSSIGKPLKSSKLKSKSRDKLNQSKQENILNSYVDTDYYDSIETQPNQPSHQVYFNNLEIQIYHFKLNCKQLLDRHKNQIFYGKGKLCS